MDLNAGWGPRSCSPSWRCSEAKTDGGITTGGADRDPTRESLVRGTDCEPAQCPSPAGFPDRGMHLTPLPTTYSSLHRSAGTTGWGWWSQVHRPIAGSQGETGGTENPGQDFYGIEGFRGRQFL